LNRIDNYFGLLRVLLGRDVALDPQLVWRHYDEPDDWDPIREEITEPRGNRVRIVKAKDMFPYISSG
jgi:hypothetical protein